MSTAQCIEFGECIFSGMRKFGHMPRNHHVLQESPVPIGQQIEIDSIDRIALCFRQRNLLETALLEHIEQLRKHHRLEAADVQQHNVLNVMPINEVRHPLALRERLRRSA